MGRPLPLFQTLMRFCFVSISTLMALMLLSRWRLSAAFTRISSKIL